MSSRQEGSGGEDKLKTKAAVLASVGLLALMWGGEAGAAGSRNQLMARTNSREAALITGVEKLVARKDPHAFEKPVKINGHNLIRLVVAREAIGSAGGHKTYDQLVVFVEPGQTLPVSSALIKGVKKPQFSIKESYTSFKAMIRTDAGRPESYDLSQVPGKNGSLEEDLGELTQTLPTGQDLSDLVNNYDQFTAAELGMLKDSTAPGPVA